MRLHPFCQFVLHFLLCAVDLPTGQSLPQNEISSTIEGAARTLPGNEVYGPIYLGSMLYRTCDQDGFFNPEHWSESGAAETYLKWSILVNKTSPAWLNRASEPNFFLRDVLDWSDLDCGVAYDGCIGVPTCDEILTRTQNETTARRIHFILLSMYNLNLVNGVVNDQSVPAQANVASMVANMANTFFWKHNDEVERKCKIKINVLKALLAALVVGTLTVLPFVGAGVIANEAAIDAEAAALASENAAIEAAETAEKAVADEAIAAGSAEEAAAAKAAEDAKFQAVVDRTIATRKRKEVDKKFFITNVYEKPAAGTFSRKVWDGKKYVTQAATTTWIGIPWAFQGLPMLVGGNDAEAKFCAKYPNPSKEAQQGHERQLDTDIRKAAVSFRASVQSDVGFINFGAGFGENGTFLPFGNTVMSDELFTGYYVKLGQTDHMRFVEEPSRIEAEITSHFKNALISGMLKEELCFLQCTRKDLGYELQDEMTSSQLEPVPGIYCQTQCWRNWKKGKNVELYGLYDLLQADNDWNVALQDFVSGSFKHWQDHRFDQRDENLFPTVGEILTGQATSSSGSFLPVCYSQLMPPVDMADKKAAHDLLPCICGNDYGNETRLFFNEAGFDRWVGHEDGHGVAEKCQWQMGNHEIPPVTTYLELCDNGWHFPLKYEHRDHLQQGADEQCDQVRALQDGLLEQGHDTRNINCRICFGTTVGSMIMANQRETIKGQKHATRDYYSFRQACSIYNQNPKTSCLY